jgi:ubiquinone/menaquinone biosynthesis C-methylase UbiE
MGKRYLFGLAETQETVNRAAAIDHSPDMIETAEKKLEHISPERIDLRTGDAADLPWDSGSFSTAASANMIFFVEQPQKVLDEIYRVLRPGGRFAMVTMGNGILGKITFGWLYSLRTYSDRTMTAMLEQAGFDTVEVKSGISSLQVCYAEKGPEK